MPGRLRFRLGVKTDPIEYRYSFPWLFRILADEGIRDVQLGSFFELYHLPDAYFLDLRAEAEAHGVRIGSLFTAHRELGGFFREERGWEQVARRNFERFIEVGGLLGADSVGSSPGSLARDRMAYKPAAIGRFLEHMRALMRHAHRCGVGWVTMEPMSCLAEPPTLPDEMRDMCEPLAAYHAANPDETAQAGLCVDVAHGYADAEGRAVFDPLQLLDASAPWLYEVHLKNTDSQFAATFGFTAAERARGIVDVARCRALLEASADRLPVREVVGYLEIGGPKLGRDYSDGRLEASLRESLGHLKQTWIQGEPEAPPVARRSAAARPADGVAISASLMCADLVRLEEEVRRLEAAGVDSLHFDVMDAHFTPNLPLGLALVGQLRRATDLPFDVHLMVEDNDFFLRALASLGVQKVSLHVESSRHLDRTLRLGRELGFEIGAALNPATPLESLDHVIGLLDFVLLMTVNPGFAGQCLVPATLGKIADCRRMLRGRGAEIPIQVDGNVSFENIPQMVAAGADSLVAGSSSLFHRGAALHRNAARMREAIAEGLRARRAEGPR
jgi:ribulose-phosphate 3-epimerase